MPLNLTAGDDDDGRRLDRILRKFLHDMPLSAIHRMLRKGQVHVDGKSAGAGFRAKSGQAIAIYASYADESAHGRHFLPAEGPRKKPVKPVPGAPLGPALEILFEGDGILALNKPAGLIVHGRESLETLVLSYLEPKIPPSLSFRPGPLHRLDRPTSGVLVFSASLEGARLFSAMLRERAVKKQYLTIVEGQIKNDCFWQDELIRDFRKKKTQTSGAAKERRPKTKTALTTVRPIVSNAGFTFILAEIKTGRTHQIRAQASENGHVLLGDRKYGSAKSDCFFLHSWRIELPSPLSRQIEAPLPLKFREKIKELFGLDSDHISGRL